MRRTNDTSRMGVILTSVLGLALSTVGGVLGTSVASAQSQGDYTVPTDGKYKVTHIAYDDGTRDWWIAEEPPNDVTQANYQDTLTEDLDGNGVLLANKLHISCSDPGLFTPGLEITKSDLGGKSISDDLKRTNYIVEYDKGEVKKVCGFFTPPGVTLEKLNDADVSGSFSDKEFAPSEDAPVQFQVKITNGSTYAITLDTMRDTFTDDTGQAFDIDVFGTSLASNTCAPLKGTTLAAGQSQTCTFTLPNYAPPPVVTQGVCDTDEELVDTVTLGATVVDGPAKDDQNSFDLQDDSIVCTENADVSFTLDKVNDADGDGTFSSGEFATGEGATVPFRVSIQNTGDVAATLTTLTDSWTDTAGNPIQFDLFAASTGTLQDNTCAALEGTSLAAGATATCTFSVTNYAPPETVNPGSTCEPPEGKVNTVRLVATPPNGDPVTLEDMSAVCTTEVDLALVKVNDADGDGTFNEGEFASDSGATVPFRVTVTNNGTSAVTLDTMRDTFVDNAGNGVAIDLFSATTLGIQNNTCAALEDSSLAAGATVTCSFTLTNYAPPQTVNAGSTCEPPEGRTNRVVLVATSNGESQTVDDRSAVCTEPNPLTVDLIKNNDASGNGTYTNSEFAAVEGQDVPFQFIITNTSQVQETVVSLVDDRIGDISQRCMNDGTSEDVVGTVLAPGASVTCYVTATNYAPAPGEENIKRNEGVVTVRDNQGRTATDDDPSFVRTSPGDTGGSILDVQIVKTNNADLTAPFSDDETAKNGPGQEVEFHVEVTNLGDPAILTELTDTFPFDGETREIDLLDGVCENQSDFLRILQDQDGLMESNEVAECSFTISNYAPQPDSPRVNTASVTVTEPNNPANQASDTDDSIVRSNPVPIGVSIVKDNDADENSTFSNDETANRGNQVVDFKVVVTNTSSITVNVDSLVDTFPDDSGTTVQIDLLQDAYCGTQIPDQLAPNQSVECTFTVANYSPDTTGSKTNTASVTVSNPDNPTDTASDSDDSIVRTPPAATVDEDVVDRSPTPPRVLARTGLDSGELLLLMFAALGAGLFFIRFGSERTVPVASSVNRAVEAVRDATPITTRTFVARRATGLRSSVDARAGWRRAEARMANALAVMTGATHHGERHQRFFRWRYGHRTA